MQLRLKPGALAGREDGAAMTLWAAGRLQVPGSCGWSGCDRLGRITMQA
jgi:hypothetical protein